MKSALGLVVAMMLVAPGCGDDTTSTASPDLSVTTPADMTATPKDMTVVKATTCGGALLCVTGCTGPSIADPLSCATACGSALAGDQKTEFTNLFTCVVENAQSPADGGGTYFDITKLTSTIGSKGPCFTQYENCMGVGLDH
jgi:hypothetical protein